MHHSFDCFLSLGASVSEGVAGRTLRLDARVVHNRPRTTVAAPVIWIENAAGDVIRSREFEPQTFHWGDDQRRTFELSLPPALAAGEYVAKMRLDRMRQGRTVVSRTFTIDG